MPYNTCKLIFIFLFTSGLTGINAQVAVPAAGGYATGNGGLVSYTIGQLFYATNTGANGSVLERIQQPIEILTVRIASGLEELKWSVFPNPTSDKLVIQTRSADAISHHLSLYDAGGNLLKNAQLTDHQTELDLKAFASGTYYLSITQDEKQVQIFKIIKNQ